MILSKDVGIDLGTANTIVYVRGKGIILREPSVVAVNVRLNKVLSVGLDAKEMLGKTPGSITAFRPLKDGVIADFDVTTEMLKRFIKKAAKNTFLTRPRVVVCIPYGVTEVERRSVEDAILHTGARAAFLIEEPLAAAIGAGLPVAEPTGCMVVDIGGGTTEVAVISLKDVVVSKSIRIAGDELDDSIVSYVKKKYNILIGERTAESIKMSIGATHESAEPLQAEVRGRNLLNGLPATVTITSAETQEAMREHVFEIIDAVKSTLEQTPPELSADIVDRGIMLTGGGALLRGLAQRLSEETGVAVNVAPNALDCVADGIGAVLEELDQFAPVLSLQNRSKSYD